MKSTQIFAEAENEKCLRAVEILFDDLKTGVQAGQAMANIMATSLLIMRASLDLCKEVKADKLQGFLIDAFMDELTLYMLKRLQDVLKDR